MELSANEIGEIVGGEVKGNGNVKLNTVLPIEEANEGALSFISNPKYEHYIYTTKASAVLVNRNFHPSGKISPTMILVDDVYSTLSSLLEKFTNTGTGMEGLEEPSHIDISSTYKKGFYLGAFSYVGKNVKIGSNVKIFPQSYIGDECIIGDNTIIYAGVKVYGRCIIGKRCILHSGCVIGSDGFGFAPQPDGSYKKMPQTGNVLLENDVEIGANTIIDRATIKSTCIREGAKLDNLIQIAHNVDIGKNTVIAAQAGISGSTKVGDNCVIGGQAGFVGHITIAKGSKFGAKSGVGKSIDKPGQGWHGIPVAPVKETLKSQAVFRKLPELYNRIKELEKLTEQLKNKR